MNAYLVIDVRIFTVSLLIVPSTLQIQTTCSHFSEGKGVWVTFFKAIYLLGDRAMSQISHMKSGNKLCRVLVAESGVL